MTKVMSSIMPMTPSGMRQVFLMHFDHLPSSWIDSRLHERNSQVRRELREKLCSGRAEPPWLRAPQPHQIHAVHIHWSALSLQSLREIWQHCHVQ